MKRFAGTQVLSKVFFIADPRQTISIVVTLSQLKRKFPTSFYLH